MIIGITGVTKMPKSCAECPLLDCYSCCKITRHGCHFDIDTGKREIHCPLYEVEEIKECRNTIKKVRYSMH